MTSEGRVDGNLNLSRALGDLFYKRDARPQREPDAQCCSVLRVRYESGVYVESR